MEKNLAQFIKAVSALVNAQSTQHFDAVLALLPKERQNYHLRFDEMFIDADKHLFFILTTNLAEWANEIMEGYDEYPDVLDDFWALFEFVQDDITREEQRKVIEQAKMLLEQII